MSGIINQVGARSGIISGGGAASASTVTLSGTTGLDYEEGNWSPTIGNGSVYTSGDQNYTKIGNMVTAWCSVNMGSNSSTNTLRLTLPFSSSISGYYLGGGSVGYHNLGTSQSNNLRPIVENGAGNVFFVAGSVFTYVTAANASGKRIDFFVTYRV